MPGDTRAANSFRPLVAGGLLGGLGFLAGYLGPLTLNPYSNLGPLVALYFSGPIALAVGLAAGVILGVVANVLAWKRSLFIASLGLTSVALLAVTLFFSLPEDRWEADLIEGQIVASTRPSSFEAEVVRQWERSIAINPQNPVSSTWRDDLRSVLAGSSDCVTDVRIVSKNALYSGRRPWNHGKLYFVYEPRAAKTVERFFVPASLCRPPSPVSRRFLARWPEYAGFPPKTAASLLNLPILEAVPPHIASLASER